MDWNAIAKFAGIIVTLFGTGSVFGYWLKSRIDEKRAERDYKRKYYLNNLSRQRDLLIEFLGNPRAEFTKLHGVGHTWDEQWRREKARTVSDWVERYRPYFPIHVQKALTGLANMAGTMVMNDGFKIAHHIEGIKAAQEWIETLEQYLNQITRELMGGDSPA